MSIFVPPPPDSAVGQAIPHESAALHVTGLAHYTDDLAGRYPGLLHAWPAQSQHAHARIGTVDIAPALAVPGVVRVLQAADVPGHNDSGIKDDEPLFPTEAMFHGQPIVWVLGETLEAARQGAAAVRVEAEPLPSLITIDEAIAAGSFQGGARTVERGDVDTALDGAAYTLSGATRIGGQEHFYLETHASIALVDESGQVFVHSSTQHPSETQAIVAHVLGRRSHEVTVQCLRMGGGFGGKEMQPHGYAAIAALGATLTGRPVRVRLNRALDMRLSGKRHPYLGVWTAGFDAEGHLVALDATLTADGGWSLDLSEPVLARALCHIDNAYWIPNIRVHGRIVKTHKTSQTAFRGFGGPQGMLVVEDILSRAAPALGLDVVTIRSRNFYAAGQTTPYGQPVRHPERMPRLWDELLTSAEVSRRRAEIAEWNATQRHTKRGLAVTPVKFGISFNLTAFNQAGSLVLVYTDGSVLVSHGGTEMGQGLHTKVAQIAASALGVPLSSVRIAPTRTDKVPNTSATAASSGTDLNGAATRIACEQIRERLVEVAAKHFGMPTDSVRIHDGQVSAEGSVTPPISWAELVNMAYFQRVQLSAMGFYRTEGLHWDPVAVHGEPFKYFVYAAAASEVEVDGFTGTPVLRRTDIVYDVGDSLSPLIDLGQIEGGFVQGAGWMTIEELRWDESDGPGRGQLLTNAASTYKLPSIGDPPPQLTVALLQGATEEGVVYGSKAVGEPPLMLAMSVREAIREAVAAFGPAGTTVELPVPATPEAVFWAVERARGGQP